MSETAVRNEVRVLHFGDVFYGSAFLSPAPERSADRRRAQTEAINRMMRYIREQEVQLVLITGNLFDESDLSDESATYLLRSFTALPRCRFVIFPGSADRFAPDCFYASGRLPANVFIFRESAVSCLRFEDLGLAVYGSAIVADSAVTADSAIVADSAVSGGSGTPAPLPVCSREEGEIVLLGGYREEMPTDAEIASSGADFIALSGSHDCRLRESGGVFLAYSGSPESRSYDDEGVGGANLLMIVDEAGARRIHAKRLEFGTARCLSRGIDISDMKSESDLIAAVARLIRENNLGRNAILRVVLTGVTRPGFRLPQKFDSNAFGLFLFSVLNLTTPVCDPQLRKDMSAKGELYRLLEPKINSGTDAERAAAARALTIGLTALEGREIDNL